MDAAQLVVKVVVDGADKAKSDLDNVGKKTKSTQDQLSGLWKNVAPYAAAGGAALIGLGVAATTMAGNFQAGITSLETGAGESAANLTLVANGIQQLALDTGQSTAQLTAGMYQIESAGYHGKQGLDVLKAAAQGAAVGNADLGSVANATTTILTDYASANINANQAVNALITTVASGKTNMLDLSSAMSTILPTASAAGVSLNDVMGALATMTGEGIPAADAATYLRQTLVALTAPGSQAAQTLKSIGLTTQDVSDAMKQSLPDALQMITDAIGKKFAPGSAQYIQALKDISGGMDQMQGLLALTGDHMATFDANALQVGHDLYFGKDQVKGWADVQGNFNTQVDKAKEAAEVFAEKLGARLLPIATQVFGWIANNAIPALTSFAHWVTGASSGAETFRSVLIPVAIVIGGALVAAFIAWAISAGAAAIATIAATWPILAIGAAIAALIAIVVILALNWNTIWGAISKFATDIWHGLQKDWNDLWFAIQATFQNIWNSVTSFFKSGINDMIDILNGFLGMINKVGFDAGPVHFHPHIDLIPHLAQGGNIMESGTVLVGERGPELLQLPAGASVTPLSGNQRSAGRQTTININPATQNIDTNRLALILRMQDMLAGAA